MDDLADDSEGWDRLIRGLVAGDEQISAEFVQRYGPAMRQVAASRLPGAAQRRVTADTVAQSACRTFLRRVELGLFDLADSDKLWQLLCAITLNKAREHVRFHLRERRSLRREDAAGGSDETAAPQWPSHEESPSVLVEFADQLEQLLNSLDEEERQIVDLKLQDRTNDEIAQALGCSERTVRRILQGLKTRFERAFAEGDS